MDTHSLASDPVDTFVEGLKTTTRLRGVELLTGSSSLPRTTRPNRIVFYPTEGAALTRAHRTAEIDIDLQVTAAIWADSDQRVWEIVRRLFWGWREWTRSESSAPMVEWGGLSFQTDDDTSEQGAAATWTLTLKAQPIADVIDPTTGEILAIQITTTVS